MSERTDSLREQIESGSTDDLLDAAWSAVEALEEYEDLPAGLTPLLPLPTNERSAAVRYAPGQLSTIATPGGEYPVMVLVQQDFDHIVLQAQAAIPDSGILLGEVFITHPITLTEG